MDYVALLKSGSANWNKERTLNPTVTPILCNVDFAREFGESDFYALPEFEDVDFSHTDLNMASLRNCMFFNCSFDNAHLTFTDLVDAYFINCTFCGTCMRVSRIGNAQFENCLFKNCDMSYCSAEETSFKNSMFINTLDLSTSK